MSAVVTGKARALVLVALDYVIAIAAGAACLLWGPRLVPRPPRDAR